MHLRRINNPERETKQKEITLSCGGDGFSYPDKQPDTLDLTAEEKSAQKQDKQQAA